MTIRSGSESAATLAVCIFLGSMPAPARDTPESVTAALPANAQLNGTERQVLERLDPARVIDLLRHYSSGAIRNRSGAGAGTVVAGSEDEKALAAVIATEMRKLGLEVRVENFPVRHYRSDPATLTANGAAVQAISLHAAGGTWGLRDGVAYRRGNDPTGHVVRAPLVDAGDGLLADYRRIGGARGKAVLVRRGEDWPVYQILEAAHQGALALLLYDYPGAPDDAIKQDSMWYHEQLPTLSISKGDAARLVQSLRQGRVEVAVENRIDSEDGISQNVVGTFRGSELPNEYTLVSAHYDRWWQSAQDNCSGVAAMLEIARALKSDKGPRRTMLFVAVGAEESGIEATEYDWLAGSHAFTSAHPEIFRRLTYNFNIDEAGWTARKGTLHTSIDLLPFQRRLIADLGLADRIEVRGSLSSGMDIWNYSVVGGGGASFLSWFGVAKDNEPLSFTSIYHTNRDVYRPEDYANLAVDLRVGALGILRMDQATLVPLDLPDVAAWTRKTLADDAAKVPGFAFTDALAAAAAFEAETQRVAAARGRAASLDAATPSNLWLMRTRKNLLPWLQSMSPTQFRTSGYTIVLAAISAAKAAAVKGDAAGTTAALEQLDTAVGGTGTPLIRMAALVSPEVAREERLYWFTSGDWSAAYEHKPRPLAAAVDDIYQRLKTGGEATREVAALTQLEDEARAHLTEAAFLVAGKLRAATRELRDTPLP